jgi:hypothetical protein
MVCGVPFGCRTYFYCATPSSVMMIVGRLANLLVSVEEERTLVKDRNGVALSSGSFNERSSVIRWTYVGFWKDGMASEVGVCTLHGDAAGERITVRGQFQKGMIDGICEIKCDADAAFEYVGEVVRNALHGFGELRVDSKFYSGIELDSHCIHYSTKRRFPIGRELFRWTKIT